MRREEAIQNIKRKLFAHIATWNSEQDSAAGRGCSAVAVEGGGIDIVQSLAEMGRTDDLY